MFSDLSCCECTKHSLQCVWKFLKTSFRIYFQDDLRCSMVLTESADPLLWPTQDNLMHFELLVKIWKENQLLNWFTVSVELQRFFALNYSAFLSSSTRRRWLGESPYRRPTHVRKILCFLANFQDSPHETSDELQYITKPPPKVRSFTVYSAHPQKLY